MQNTASAVFSCPQAAQNIATIGGSNTNAEQEQFSQQTGKALITAPTTLVKKGGAKNRSKNRRQSGQTGLNRLRGLNLALLVSARNALKSKIGAE